MEAQISSNVIFMTTTKETWDALSMMYSSDKKWVRIFELFSKILSLQGDQTLIVYYHTLMG